MRTHRVRGAPTATSAKNCVSPLNQRRAAVHTHTMLRFLLLAVMMALAVGFSGPATLVARPTAGVTRTEAIEMGRGDRRTKRGKRNIGSFGNSRPRNDKLRRAEPGPASTPPAAAEE